jgi:hypothetical protein
MSLTFAAAPPRRMGTPARAPRFVDQDDDVDLVATSLGQLRFLPGDGFDKSADTEARKLTAAAAAAEADAEALAGDDGDAQQTPATDGEGDDEERELSPGAFEEEEEGGLASGEDEGGDEQLAGEDEQGVEEEEEEEEAAGGGGEQGSVGREKVNFDRTACYGALLGNRRKC